MAGFGNLPKGGREDFPEEVTLQLLCGGRGREVGGTWAIPAQQIACREALWQEIAVSVGREVGAEEEGRRQGPDPQDFAGL